MPEVSGAETAVFWLLAPLSVISALMLVVSKNAVHSALWLVVTMFTLAVFYGVQGAYFLAAVQIIVYTGAIMILFLFVLMLVGVDSSDSLVETLKGQRIASIVLGLGFAGLLIGAIGSAMTDAPVVGLEEANAEGNVVAVARLLFHDYVFAFEATSALLITAAVGAMVLAHQERLVPRPTQRDLSRQRFTRPRPQPLPGPGVYARTNRVDAPALTPDGSVAPDSLSAVVPALPEGTSDTGSDGPVRMA